MKKTLALAAAGEAAIGLVLLVYPPIVVRVLFGAEIAEVGGVVSRVAGISLIALGVACWSGSDQTGGNAKALAGMLTYSFLVTMYLLYLGFVGMWVGILLWPTVIFHAVITILLGWEWFNERKTLATKA